MEIGLTFWLGFMAFILIMLALDLGIFHKTAHVVTFREACTWSAIWIALALLFNYGIYEFAGEKTALEFLTGYLIEYSLSIDNVFVFVLIFAFFGVPAELQNRVLILGIALALVLRLLLIFAGVALIEQFAWVIYIFGAFLIVTGIKMLVASDKPKDLNQNPVLKIARKTFQFTDGYVGQQYFVMQGNKRIATPLLLVFIMVAITDVIFAVDSIPAILAITHDSFIVFTSNAFAILGLRSMFFMLAGLVTAFRYLKTGLAFVLMFIGVKMIIGHSIYHIETFHSLMVVITILAVSILASVIANKRDQVRHGPQ
ncbi:MAG: TerC family protein [Alphaproteobacteria bacterium]|nr:MAG: TerC family protein [Alphaproteobacteria bacterium]